MTKEIEKCIRIMFPKDPEARTRHILKRLRNDRDKDHHCAGSLTHLGRCALDHAAADIIESLSEQLEQTENKLSELLYYVTGGRYSKTDYSTDDMRRFVDDYNQSTCDECDKCDELEQVTRERDAAVEMFRDKCEYCKHFHVTHNGCTPDCDCHATDCQRIDGHWTGWQWIGVEVTNDAQKGSDAKS